MGNEPQRSHRAASGAVFDAAAIERRAFATFDLLEGHEGVVQHVFWHHLAQGIDERTGVRIGDKAAKRHQLRRDHRRKMVDHDDVLDLMRRCCFYSGFFADDKADLQLVAFAERHVDDAANGDELFQERRNTVSESILVDKRRAVDKDAAIFHALTSS